MFFTEKKRLALKEELKAELKVERAAELEESNRYTVMEINKRIDHYNETVFSDRFKFHKAAWVKAVLSLESQQDKKIDTIKETVKGMRLGFLKLKNDVKKGFDKLVLRPDRAKKIVKKTANGEDKTKRKPGRPRIHPQ